MHDPWFTPLVWADYRLATLFTVFAPFALLVWAFIQKNDTIQRLLVIYWRVASLLMITVYLMVAAVPVSFVSGLMARILIPLSQWFWIDLNENLADQPSGALKGVYSSWRWLITLYCGIGAIAQIPFLQCAISNPLLRTRFCGVWLDPPWLFKEYFHAGTAPRLLGFLGFVALLIYVSSLTYFVMVKLSRHGRSALEH